MLLADSIISPDSLPSLSKEFLQKNFNAQIGLVQVDKDVYEVHLSDGTEIEFSTDGSWKEIESKGNPLSFGILPRNLADIVKNEFPNAFMLEVKKKINYYKIKLNNGLKIRIDPNGTILRRKFDN